MSVLPSFQSTSMSHDERVALLKSGLHEPIEKHWSEPFHDAWLESDGEDERVRFAMAFAAELAAAQPVIKPGELIIGCNGETVETVTGLMAAMDDAGGKVRLELLKPSGDRRLVTVKRKMDE